MRTRHPKLSFSSRAKQWLALAALSPRAEKILFFLFLFSLAIWLRYAFVMILHQPGNFASSSDMGDYVQGAQNVLAGRGPIGTFGPGFKPIGYYYFVALLFRSMQWAGPASRFVLLNWTNILFSLLTPILMWRASRRWLTRENALIVLVVGLFHFPFLSYAGFVLAELPFLFLLALFVWGLMRLRYPWKPGHAMWLGAIWGVSVVIKGQSLLFAPLGCAVTLLPAIWRSGRKSFPALRPAVRGWTFFALAGLVPLAAQSACFSYYAHHFIFLPTVSGVNFLAAKLPECRNLISSDGYWVCSPVYALIGGCDPSKSCRFGAPFSDAHFYFHAAFDAIRRDPARLFQGMRNFLYLFVGNEAFPILSDPGFNAVNRFSEYLYVLFVFPGLLIALLRGLSARHPARLRLLIALAWTGLFPYFFLLEGEIRFRVPFDVALIPLSIWGWTSIASRLRETRRLRSRKFFLWFWVCLTVPWTAYTIHQLLVIQGRATTSRLLLYDVALAALALLAAQAALRAAGRARRALWTAPATVARRPIPLHRSRVRRAAVGKGRRVRARG